MEASKQNKEGDLGYWVRKDHWGEGIASEAVTAILDFGFNTHKLNRIYATACPENIGSLRVLEKCGMSKEGVMREHMNIRGNFRDSVLMAILASEFKTPVE